MKIISLNFSQQASVVEIIVSYVLMSNPDLRLGNFS